MQRFATKNLCRFPVSAEVLPNPNPKPDKSKHVSIPEQVQTYSNLTNPKPEPKPEPKPDLVSAEFRHPDGNFDHIFHPHLPRMVALRLHAGESHIETQPVN